MKAFDSILHAFCPHTNLCCEYRPLPKVLGALSETFILIWDDCDAMIYCRVVAVSTCVVGGRFDKKRKHENLPRKQIWFLRTACAQRKFPFWPVPAKARSKHARIMRVFHSPVDVWTDATIRKVPVLNTHF